MNIAVADNVSALFAITTPLLNERNSIAFVCYDNMIVRNLDAARILNKDLSSPSPDMKSKSIAREPVIADFSVK